MPRMCMMLKVFYSSIIVSILGVAAAFYYGGLVAVTIVAILAVLEISLSFDNAIVNASILKDMEPKWQDRFITWGILVAVFGMRFIFPIVLVAFVTHLSSWEVLKLAVQQPEDYARYLTSAHASISAFGGMFLLMVFLGFILNHKRDIHWLGVLEQKIGLIGNLESIEVVVAMLILLALQSIIPGEMQATVLISGIAGLATYVIIHSLAEYMNEFYRHSGVGTKFIRSGFISFVYLEVLDASFSFDGVIGAFAITKDVVIIMIGLAIGAFFVRSLTLLLVHRRVLQNYVYLEHGAHYAIGALALMMLFSIVDHIRDIYIGGVGVIIIFLAYISSVLYKRKTDRKIH
jgi:hypothetical protein